MKQAAKKEYIKREPIIKFVKAAKSWCKTLWVNGVQKQEWASTKEGFKEDPKDN